MRTAHVFISGRVQGVGYRAWTEAEALRRGLTGWVRNCRDGRVEALFCGAETAVNDMLGACRQGPPAAGVSGVTNQSWSGESPEVFRVLPTERV